MTSKIDFFSILLNIFCLPQALEGAKKQQSLSGTTILLPLSTEGQHKVTKGSIRLYLPLCCTLLP